MTPSLATAPKPSPRERLLEAANELFYAEGVHSVGIDRVIERAGVAKASLYDSFGSKDGLIGAYLESRHEQTLGRLQAAAARETEPVAKILAIFDSQARTMALPGYRGCAFAAASAESPAGGRVDIATRTYRDEVRALFTQLAEAAGAPDPSRLGRQLHLLYDGAGLAANLEHDPGIAGPERAAAETLIAAALGRPIG
jgi:AcrR family transcriptional regulator